MKHIILGTAGHIDHGKTTFIKALTGIDCDRLKEEKERGITIELGYANMTLPSGAKVGIVDVPGHERFVSKMVAGASGIDVVAFIIAADEGIKPQTKEHLYICDLLGVKKGIVVLTKKDLVDADLLELQKDDICHFLKGSVLENAAIIPVSSVTGEGLDKFMSELDRLAGEITVKPVQKPFRLPIDDVITIKGFGTVVRGTAISGMIFAGEELTILPAGIKSRIRGLQSHGEKIEQGFAGERIAVNLADAAKEYLDRGMLAARAGYFIPTERLLVEIRYLPYNEKPMKSRINCQFHVLTSRVSAEIFLLNKERLLPGESGFAMARLSKPVVVSYGDPYVIRGYGIYTTMGGGRILNPALRSLSRNGLTEEYLKTLSEGEQKQLISTFAYEKKEKGITLNALCGMLNGDLESVKDDVQTLKKAGTIFEDDKGLLFNREIIFKLKEKIYETVMGYHAANPLKMGINKEELLIKTGELADIFPLALQVLTQEKRLALAGDIIKDAVFNLSTSGQEDVFLKIEKAFLNYGLQPDDIAEIAKKLNMEERKLKDALSSMTKSGRIAKVNDNYYLHSQILENAKNAVVKFFEKKPVLTPQDAREILGLSRKFMIPLLEYLDGIKLTIRVQEGRKLRKQ